MTPKRAGDFMGGRGVDTPGLVFFCVVGLVVGLAFGVGRFVGLVVGLVAGFAVFTGRNFGGGVVFVALVLKFVEGFEVFVALAGELEFSTGGEFEHFFAQFSVNFVGLSLADVFFDGFLAFFGGGFGRFDGGFAEFLSFVKEA